MACEIFLRCSEDRFCGFFGFFLDIARRLATSVETVFFFNLSAPFVAPFPLLFDAYEVALCRRSVDAKYTVITAEFLRANMPLDAAPLRPRFGPHTRTDSSVDFSIFLTRARSTDALLIFTA